MFLRIIESSVGEKCEALLAAISSLNSARNEATHQRIAYEADPNAFAAIPGSPFAYWVGDVVRGAFSKFERFEGADRSAKQGLVTADDFRFLRAWWEVPSDRLNHRWFGFAKGGAFSPFYADIALLVGYSRGDQVGLQAIGRYGRGATLYFRPGLTWPLRTSGLSLRALPTNCIFSHKGPLAVVEGDNPNVLLALSAIMNSRAFGYFVSVQLARTELAQSYEVGIIQQTPVPRLSSEDTASLARLARRAWSLKRSTDTGNETSHAFLLPPGLNEQVLGLNLASVERDLESIQSEIDDAAFTLYGIGSDDRSDIDFSVRRPAAIGTPVEAEGDDGEESDAATALEAGRPEPRIYSWLVGIAFGRFDPRFVTELVDSYKATERPPYTLLAGRRSVPPEPEPFDALPTRSPGMWPEDEVPVVLPPKVMVDDPGHTFDLCSHVTNAATRTGIADPEDLRQWLATEFFPLHIKMYSRSRRKAPIYWQLATPSASYSVWLYIHTFSDDTLFRVQNDYVAPKLAQEERRLESLTSELRDNAAAALRKQLAAQETLVDELRAFLDEAKRVAPLWKPDLDDGVIINFAPLWRLVPQNKSWQKELKSTWDALCDGMYDWAHLAMHLWPERVVAKCAQDRSLAIVHGLEEVFWVEGTDSKWIARDTPTRSVEELVLERTSPAVKSALESLLEAPAAIGAAKRPRKGKANA